VCVCVCVCVRVCVCSLSRYLSLSHREWILHLGAVGVLLMCC